LEGRSQSRSVAWIDREFIIQGREEGKLRRLFANAHIRKLIAAQPAVHFEVKEARDLFVEIPPENVDVLEFLTGGVIKDKGKQELTERTELRRE